MFKAIRTARQNLLDQRKAEAIDLAKANDIKLYEIETYDGYKLRVELPTGSNVTFTDSSKLMLYREVSKYLHRWVWKNTETEVT